MIVWAHNDHVMNYNYIAKSEAAAKRAGPMGQFLKAELGAGLYTISDFCYSTKLLRTCVLVCILTFELQGGCFVTTTGNSVLGSIGIARVVLTILLLRSRRAACGAAAVREKISAKAGL